MDNKRPWTSFFVLLLFVFIGMFIGQLIGLLVLLPWVGIQDLLDPGFLANIMTDPAYKQAVLIMNGCVAACAFIIAPLAYLYLYEKKSITIFFNNNKIISIPLLLTIFIVVAFMSVNSIFIEWNANVDFPDFMHGFEVWAKKMEQQAQELTILMTRFDHLGDFILAMVVMGLIPSIGEELLFRGLIQNQLGVITKNIHVAIWLAAFLFSVFHFQFYGFVPRMFLGVLFGYLYYWSGNLYVAILAHFVNNGLTLILLYLYQQEIVDFDIETSTAVPMANVLFSFVLGIALMFYFKKYITNRIDNHG